MEASEGGDGNQSVGSEGMTMIGRACCGVSCLALMLACGPPHRVVATPTAAELPAALVEFIEERWPGARVAAPEAVSTCPGSSSSGVAGGDFNGDGVPDIVVRVLAPDGVYLVEALAHTDNYTFYDTRLEGDLAAASIAVRKRGEQFASPSGAGDFFGADTAVVACGTAVTAYFWTGTGLDPRKIGN